ncbi:MAG: ATP-binding protein [Bacteroidota bacterium]|nr:ATP-binding protein [Bacteroidota bacterium]
MTKILNTLIFSMFMLLYSCSTTTEKQQNSEEATITETKEPTLTKTWETDSVMITAESTLFDKESNTIYVSNINGHHSEKDGNGFISKLKPDGSIDQLKWIEGLNAPKGLARMDDLLYVADIDALVEINIGQSKISNRYPVQGAKFLNDVATDGKNIYFTDTETGIVHVLEGGKINTVAEGMSGINGIAFNGKGEMHILDGKGLRKYNKQNQKSEFLNEAVTGGDGLIIIDDSTFIASRWQGEIYLIKGGKEHLLLDTKRDESNTADIGYIKEQNLVLVPTFMKNKVVAYKLDY